MYAILLPILHVPWHVRLGFHHTKCYVRLGLMYFLVTWCCFWKLGLHLKGPSYSCTDPNQKKEYIDLSIRALIITWKAIHVDQTTTLPKTNIKPSIILCWELYVILWLLTPGDKDRRAGPLYKVMTIATPTHITSPTTFTCPLKLLILIISNLQKN